MFKTYLRAGVLAGAAALLSACGGGGSHSSVVPGQSSPRSPQTLGAETRYTPPVAPVSATTNLAGITGGVDGNLYFAETSVATTCTLGGCSGRISKLTTAGSITQYGLPNYIDANNVGHPVYPFSLMQGADNNIWFLSADGYFGHIATDGTGVTLYDLHQLGSDTSGTFNDFTQGADGSFYVAETSPERIIKVTTTGTASVFNSSLSSGANVGLILLNGDNNFYFTERGTNKIGKLDSTGTTLSEYASTASGSYQPLGLTSDGTNVWYVAQGVSGSSGQRLVQMSSSGTIVSNYAITSSPAGIGPIARYRGTYTWTVNDNVSRIRNTTGVVNDFTLSHTSPGTPINGMTAGSDGNMWFTDPANNQIVKIRTS